MLKIVVYFFNETFLLYGKMNIDTVPGVTQRSLCPNTCLKTATPFVHRIVNYDDLDDAIPNVH